MKKPLKAFFSKEVAKSVDETRERLNTEYPFEISMRFKTKDAAKDFIAGWLDGGLEQMCNASTLFLDDKKQTWAWPKPSLYVKFQEEPEDQ